jgi:hypothetical protein
LFADQPTKLIGEPKLAVAKYPRLVSDLNERESKAVEIAARKIQQSIVPTGERTVVKKETKRLIGQAINSMAAADKQELDERIPSYEREVLVKEGKAIGVGYTAKNKSAPSLFIVIGRSNASSEARSIAMQVEHQLTYEV